MVREDGWRVEGVERLGGIFGVFLPGCVMMGMGMVMEDSKDSPGMRDVKHGSTRINWVRWYWERRRRLFASLSHAQR